MRLVQKLKQFERKYMFLKWATAEEYGKLKYVGYDFVEFDVINIDTMEYRETILINSQLILEVVVGGADIARIIAEISSQLPSVNKE
ncbi:MAG: hypothetical protein WCG95_07900 [bacterium]